MHIIISGGAGFLGVRLARTLLSQGVIRLAGASAQTITRITLVDRAAPPQDLAIHPKISTVVGDLIDLLTTDAACVIPADAQAVVHLASAVSGECESNFDLGMRSNLQAGLLLLERCRALGSAPLFVFSSSLAVFGNSAALPLPDIITDTTLPTPQGSYGTQKFVLEQLVADYSRKGFLRGRNIRLMTVSVRPGRPNGAASSFLSGMIREPLAGIRATCPVPPDTPVALSSPARTIEGIMRALQTSDEEWGPRIGMNLPALTTTPAKMAAALEKVAGKAGLELIDWQVDPQIAALVTSWPAHFQTERAKRLGLTADPDFESIVRDYVHDNLEAVKVPLSI